MSSGAPRGQGQVVRLSRGASLSDFADRINANPGSLVQEMFNLGEMVTATQSCSDDTLLLLGEHLGFDVQIVSPEDEDRELLAQFNIDLDAEVDEDRLVTRPPVVTVMGHVDHGKTKLLDAIRKTNVVAGEAGGITQHIGAYQVHVAHDGDDRAITFIDTPGHEAFTAMRARGAQVTDIVVLVVAADDGVMPQTIEALNHAKAADVPIVVAVNKVDKPEANPDKVRQQLTEYGLVAEEYGGETMFVNVAAKPGIGIDELLEAVLLTADASLELTAPIDGPAQGVAIEAHLDKGRGAVATVLVQKGTLRAGDSIVAGGAHGRVRAMLDENGQQVAEAGPARPVMVLGLTAVPSAGDTFLAADGRPHGAADRRAAAGTAAGGELRQLPWPGHARDAHGADQGGREDLAQPHPQGRRLRFGGGPGGRAVQAGDPGGGPAQDHPPGRRCDHRERRHAGERLGRGGDDHRLQRAGLEQGPRDRRPRGRGDPVLHA